MKTFLFDEKLLKEIDEQRLKKQYIKIIVLDWKENPIQEMTGRALGGSINLDGSSSFRRTGNINVWVDNIKNDITNPNYWLSINKKISIEIGIENNFAKDREEDIFWFPMGIFVIVQSSISSSLSGTNISLQLKDKMCLLSGECGGTIPAAVTFSEIETINSKGELVVTHPTIVQIIRELVNHWGGEQLGKIFINDLDTRIKKVMKWTGSVPLYCFNEGNGVEFTVDEKYFQGKNFTEVFAPSAVITGGKDNPVYIKFLNGRDVGYIYTDFIFPDELIGDAGTTVTAILDQIRDTLGNYEYFYDLDGNFVFQEIKNYLNTTHAKVELDKLNNSNYLVDQSRGKAVYNFDDSTLISSYNNNPQYDMIKNDFIVWGMRTDIDDKNYPIRYHLAIDKKPQVGMTHKVFKYLDPEDKILKAKSTFPVDNKADLPKEGVQGVFFRNTQTDEIYTWDINSQSYITLAEKAELITSKDWRTEYYLQGVDAEPYGTDSNPYYVELQSEWPKLYNIWGEAPDFLPRVKQDPSNIDFYLDFIDSEAAIGEYSINNIGKRTKVIVDDNVNCLFAPDIPDIILLESDSPDIAELRAECERKGQNYTQVEDSIYSQLAGGGHFNSAYDRIREMLFENTNYNESISLECIPIYHLDVNTRISVNYPISDIHGDYIINSINIPLDVGSNMSIGAVRAVERF